MAIKGVALTIGYYRDYSLRPVEDLDLLVHWRDARNAIELLRCQGWKCLNPWADANGFSNLTRQNEHALHFCDSSGCDLHLHWNLFPFCLGPDTDEEFWSAGRKATLEASTWQVLNPADELLDICMQRNGADQPMPILWVPDAVAVIEKSPNINWHRLLHQAQKRKLTIAVSSALNQIHQIFPHLVPPEILSEINRSKVTVFEYLESGQLFAPILRAGRLTKALAQFWRISSAKNLSQTILSYPDYLCSRWQIPSKRQLPLTFYRRVSGRFAMFLTLR
jgi:hypothetical protein